MLRFAALATLLFLPACATIVGGTSQQMSVSTSPAGAACDFTQNGTHIGTVAPTPGSLRVDRSKNDITVACTKPGYQSGSIVASSEVDATTAGNIILGGIIGLAIDAASGADYKYPSQVHLDLAPENPASPIASR